MLNSLAGRKRLADVGLVYAAAIWGATFFLVKEVLNEINPIILVGYRFILAAALMLILSLALRKPLFKNFHKGLLLGLFLWLLYIPQTIGLGITTASNSGFITGRFVAFVPLFSIIIFRRLPSLLRWGATAISLAGLWILSGGLADFNRGDLYTLAAAMFYAVHILFVDKFLAQGDNPYTLCFQQFLLVGMLGLIWGGAADLPFTWGSGKNVAIVLFLTIFPTFSAFVVQVIAQQFIAPIRVSLIFALEPVFAAIFAWTLGGESIIPHRAAGGLLIFMAMILSGVAPASAKGKKGILKTGSPR